MEDIKVGDFVRTDSGEIFKVIDVEKGSVKIKSNYKEWIGLCCISKHSPNIIELIEVGDIISLNYMGRIFKVIKIDENRIYGAYETLSKSTMLQDYKVKIVTKEQFKSVSYEV